MMSKVKEWEYDDTMHDYTKWTDELRRLLSEDEPDMEEIERVKKVVDDYENALFSQQESER